MIAEEVIQVIDGTLDDIENFDEISLEHWEYFKNKKLPHPEEYGVLKFGTSGLLRPRVRAILPEINYVACCC